MYVGGLEAANAPCEIALISLMLQRAASRRAAACRSLLAPDRTLLHSRPLPSAHHQLIAARRLVLAARFSRLSQACENVYLGIFTIELLLKVVAYGFLFHDGAYLHDAWCQLDFVVVTLAWVPIFFPTFTNFSAIRSVRALRPLRALKRVPGMPVLIRSIIDALPRLITVAALCGFVLFVFGIVGVEFYKGALHYHCTDGTDGEAREDAANVLLVADDLCDPTAPEAAQCGEGRRCLYYAAGPMAGTMGFDNMGMAMVALLQALTADAYDEVMHALMATTSYAAREREGASSHLSRQPVPAGCSLRHALQPAQALPPQLPPVLTSATGKEKGLLTNDSSL